MVAIVASPQASPGYEPIRDGHLVAVNAAFLQEIKDSSPDVRHQRSELFATCHSPHDSHLRLGRFVRQLNDFRDQLAVYFSLEETYGYCDRQGQAPELNLAKNEPDSAGSQDSLADTHTSPRSDAGISLAKRNAGEIRHQHGQLYLQLTDLIEVAEELQYRGLPSGAIERLAQRVVSFLDQLDEHERAEADLIGSFIKTTPSPPRRSMPA